MYNFQVLRWRQLSIRQKALHYSFFSLFFLRMEVKKVLKITTWNCLNPQFERPQFYANSLHPYLNWSKGREKRAMEYLPHLDSTNFSFQETNQQMCNSFTSALNSKHPKSHYKCIWKERNQKQDDGFIINCDADHRDLHE